ncbi:TIR domain-containing protein [Zunongwangia sp. SCSIO 43204]|uniref:TIR domain-containing protein n=1 Tax=Zunongwangia sp. SCSIO 43204 TaxID=2779359 RepID=UPI001CA809D2|nr:TIR domain-containing protein [Zunongwangia sp. SCSIO 43204]UAB82851.1 TIR domain-containing protein [Zunongwangia sp. SCSIO 43204]
MSKEFVISKLSFRDDEQLIDTVRIGLVNDNSVEPFETKDRNWLVKEFNNGNIIRGVYKGVDNLWYSQGVFRVEDGCFKWGYPFPKNISKRNVFVSYYHKDDQLKRKQFDNLFSDLIINQSVMLDEISGENSDDYIHRLINEGYMKDTTVLTILLGPNTKCRKHVDWEIGGALNVKVGDRYAGLLGIRLPSHPDYGLGTDFNPDYYPIRFAANLESGYAVLADWSEDRRAMQDLIELAFSKRKETDKIKNASIQRLAENSCE